MFQVSAALPDPAGNWLTAIDGGVRVLFSGTLFEPEELAQRLGVSGRSLNAASLVLIAYRELASEWVHALRGHYAIVVDDRSHERVTAVRDAMGLHPLFVASGASGLLFSPSTDALLAQPGVSRALNRVALAEHLLHRWSDPIETYFEAVQRVPPGHVFESDARGRRFRRYWDPSTTGTLQWLRDEEVERFGDVLTRAVTRCMQQGRAGIFLSGGFDSISIAAVAADEASKLGQPVPHALSLGFPDPACNEEPTQRGAAQALGMPQDLLSFTEAVGERGLLLPAAEMAASWPVPMTNLWNPAYFPLARRGHAHGCRVILTGSGGDEWLTVSPYLSADLIRKGALADVLRFIGVIRRSYKVTTRQAVQSGLWTFGLRPVVAMLANRIVPAHFQARRTRKLVASTPSWIAPDPALRRTIDERAPRVLSASEPHNGSFYEQEMRTAIEHPLNAIEAEEFFEMGRRVGVQMMHPYRDSDLVEMLYRTPPRFLMRGGRAKGLVRDTIARRFPTLGFERQRKVHATDFYWRTMQTEGPAAWRSVGEATTLAALGVVDPKLHAATMSELFAGRQPHESYRIWNTLQLEVWARSRA
ncbi:MAG: asparagine synthase-related protein [Vicinamibacterales bacterium]